MRRPFGGGGAIDWLIVGLGNPGREHAATRHNVGFMVAEALIARWGLGRAKDRFRGRIVEGRVDGAGALPGPRRPRVAILCPQTFMNDAGRSVGPARGAFKLPVERVGVGRPDSTDPEIVSAHVLSRFAEDDEQVRRLVERASEQVERVVLAGGVEADGEAS